MAQLATTTIYGDLIVQRDIYLSGVFVGGLLQSSSYTIRIPSDSTSWSGGVTFYTSDGATLIGGFGLSKSPSAIQHLYMAHGSNPASSGYGIYVVPSGNVGIGTTNPAYKLDVAGDIRFTGTLQGGTVPWARLSGVPTASTSQAGIVQLNNSVTSTSTTQAATANAVKTAYDTAVAANNNANNRVAKSGDTMTGNLMFSGGTRYIGTSDSNSFVLRTANADRVTIISNGNVGIGTSSPSQKLHVAGNAQVDGNLILNIETGVVARVESLDIRGTGSTSVIGKGLSVSWDTDFGFFGLVDYGSDRKDVVIANEQPGDNFRFMSQGQTIVLITGSGNVGIGTTAPAQRLHVNGNIRVGDGSTSNMPIRYVSNDGVSYRIVLPVGPDKWAT